MKELSLILLLLYLISLIYYIFELSKEVANWRVNTDRKSVFYLTVILSIVGAFIPLLNTIVSINIIKDKRNGAKKKKTKIQ